jgi:hypothetical protein
MGSLIWQRFLLQAVEHLTILLFEILIALRRLGSFYANTQITGPSLSRLNLRNNPAIGVSREQRHSEAGERQSGFDGQ